jgi:hypothetical protein
VIRQLLEHERTMNALRRLVLDHERTIGCAAFPGLDQHASRLTSKLRDSAGSKIGFETIMNCWLFHCDGQEQARRSAAALHYRPKTRAKRASAALLRVPRRAMRRRTRRTALAGEPLRVGRQH